MLTNRVYKALLFILTAVSLPMACAAWQSGPGDVSVEIVGDDGRVLRQFDVSRADEPGARRAYLEAVKGKRYGIRIRNHRADRIGLVIAVDGRNIISGKKSHLRRDEPMYLLNPYQTAAYDGWRTSDTRVHRFYFTEAGDSYADAFGDRTAMGVISVAAYAEKPHPRHKRLYRNESREDAARSAAPPATLGGSAKSAPAEQADAQPGTGFGEGVTSRVVRVRFEPSHQPFAKRFLKYEWRDSLVQMGFIRAPAPANRFWPEHVGQASGQGYAPYPPGYRPPSYRW